MGDNLFQGLPPPSAPSPPLPAAEQPQSSNTITNAAKHSPPQRPPSALKSALKRSKPAEPQSEVPGAAMEKHLRFKTTTDASETQVIEAMQKIASHIKTPSKFSKASKLAIQLIMAGSVKPGTTEYFFAILESAMSSPTACNDTSLRMDYHSLFSAAQDIVELFNQKQRNQLTTWTIRAVVANDLLTDDSFVFSKATTRIKEAILNLPVATKDEDVEEAATLEAETEVGGADGRAKPEVSSVAISEGNHKIDTDPFGLDALIPRTSKRDEKSRVKKEVATKIKEEEEESKRFLKSLREALILCLEIAARRYKTPWCQTGIDILVKHASDNISRFTGKQRDAIERLWASIREQHTRRKQGKSVSGKLDVTAFEFLQQKYSTEKISIRHSVGGSGDRRCEQWLG
ncbi:hypothetical protein NMG60_11022186 [Bertholletia excelsa]